MDLTIGQKAEIASEVEKRRKNQCRRGGRNTKRVCHNWDSAYKRQLNYECRTCKMLDSILETIDVIPAFTIRWYNWLEENDMDVPDKEVAGTPIFDLVRVTEDAEDRMIYGDKRDGI